MTSRPNRSLFLFPWNSDFDVNPIVRCQLEMEDDDVIEVMQEQTGGHS